MALKRLSVHLEPHIDEWLRKSASKNGRSINQELNELLSLVKRKREQQQKRDAFEATKARLAEVLARKTTPKGVAH